MPLRAVLFDGFGTLFDGAPTLAESIEDAVRAAHARLLTEGHDVPWEEFRAAYGRAREAQKAARRDSNREYPIDDRLEAALRELDLPAGDLPRLTRSLSEAHMAGFERFLLVHPEAPEALRDLRARGLKIGVASNYYHGPHLRRILAIVGLAPLVDVAVASADVGYVKPDPALFREVLKRLDVRPGEALMVGDTPDHDVFAAQAHGMRGAYVPNPRDPKAPRECPGADVVVARLGDLPAAIARLS